MKKTKAQQSVKKSQVKKAAKAVKVSNPRKALKPVKATPTTKVSAHITKSKKPSAAHPAKHSKFAAVQTPANETPEAEVILIKTHKWSATESKQFKERLQRLHDMAVDDIGYLAGGRAGGMVSNLNGDGQTTEEDGTDNFTQDLALMQMSNKQDMLNKIIDAFRRLDLHTYGLCEDCGELIAKLRLEVQPFATMCIKCQSAAEANRPRHQGFRKAMTVGQMVENDQADAG